MLLGCSAAIAQQRDVNYEEDKVPAYQLPELLRLEDGKVVRNTKDWEERRRPELLRIFSQQMYGTTPSETIPVSYRVIESGSGVLGGKADRQQVEFSFTNNGKSLKALLLIYTPAGTTGKVPFVVGYNYKGNHSVSIDSNILYSDGFKRVREPGHADWKRGNQESRWPIEYILSQGYGVATMNYHDIFPDKAGLKDYSIMALFTGYSKAPQPKDEWQAIGAWAWGSSRILDYLYTLSIVDKDKIVLMGHSRQGKAALWAGAQDPRFSVVISNNSGSGGAALSKRVYGETIKIVSTIQPSWFAPALDRYHDKEAEMPFDQHQLIALMAPRPVYIASAVADRWADPKGEFLAAYHASPVYSLYGLKGLTSPEMPDLNQPLLDAHVGYHIRSGGHDVKHYDWEQFLKFADLHFKR